MMTIVMFHHSSFLVFIKSNDPCRSEPPTDILTRTGIFRCRTTCKHGRKFYKVEILEIHSQSGIVPYYKSLSVLK
jgi:hypothetical protein